MRDGGAYGCAVPRAYANLNPGLNLEVDTLTDSKPVELSQDRSDVFSTGRACIYISSNIYYLLLLYLSRNCVMQTYRLADV